MTRDYAKKRTISKGKKAYTKANSRKPQQKPAWTWLVAGLVIGLFIAGLVYIQQYQKIKPRHVVEKIVTTHHQVATKKSKSHQPKILSQHKPEPHFDFYTILPKMKVYVPETNNALQVKKTPINKTQNNQYYILQVASFQQYRDADHLKAKLTLQGYNVDIQAFKHQGKHWNRVFTGPYASESQAKKAQQALEKQHVKSMLVKLDKPH